MSPSKALAKPAAGLLQSLPLETLRDLAIPVAVLAIVMALITPLPGWVLDMLIVTDLLMSITVLMVSLYIV